MWACVSKASSFFWDRVGALRELRRALRPGGRVGVSVWCEIEASEPFAAVATAIAQVLGSDEADGCRNGPCGRIDAQQLQEMLSAAGFANVDVSREKIAVVFADVDHFIRTMGAAPVGAKVQALGADGRRALRSAVEKAASSLIDDCQIRGMTTCHTATGTA